MAKIFTLVAGKGRAKFEKLAFDRALRDAGLADVNLVPVSSILPKGFSYRPLIDLRVLEKGSIVFGVFYWNCSNVPGTELYAGLGVSMFASGWGVVIEHKAQNISRKEFLDEINEMLDTMIDDRAETEVKRLTVISEDTVPEEAQYSCVFAGLPFLEEENGRLAPWCGGRDSNPRRH
jgi:arginine decarboxylase